MKAHVFPPLRGKPSDQGYDEGDAGKLFQPLYGCGAGDRSKAAERQKAANGLNRSPDPITAARGSGFETGFYAGEREARETVKKTLRPDLEAFFTAFEALVSFQSMLAENAADHILELAFLIAEQVMATPCSLDRQALQGLKRELESTLLEAYRLTLVYHPESLEVLQQVLSCNQLQWPQHRIILTQTNQTQPKDHVAVDKLCPTFENHAFDNLSDHLQSKGHVSTA